MSPFDKCHTVSSLWEDAIIHEELYGRNLEKQQMIESYDRVRTILCCAKHNRHKDSIANASTEQEPFPISEFVLVEGETGCGKTTLVRSLQEMVQRDCGYYIEVQFGETYQPEPYAAFVTAINEFFRLVLTRGPSEIAFFQKKINRHVKAEHQHVLTEMIPILQQILTSTNNPTSKDRTKNNDYDNFNQFKHMFHNLMGAITLSHNPIVFVLDDLHWADESSLDLLFTLLVDSSSRNGILYIGTYRSYDQSKRFRKFLDRIICDPIRLNVIPLCNFSSKQVNGLLAQMMHTEADVVESFSELIHCHTNGNLFYSMEYLRYLQSNGLLDLEGKENESRWKIDEINGVVKNLSLHDLFLNSIQHMSASTQHFLACAACLGTNLDENILKHFCLDPINVHLAILARQRMITYDHITKCWKFSHDAVKETCRSMIPVEVINEFQYQLGRKLWLEFSIDEIDRYIFVVVGLLLFGIDSVCHQKERMAIAKLCLHAGERSVESSNFQNAFEYLSKGVALMDVECWRSDYSLSLQLCNVATEVAYSVGNYDDVERFGRIIRARAREFCDTIPSHCSNINVLGSKGQLHKAIHVGLDVLKKLGEPLSSGYGNTRVYLEAKRLEKLTKNMSDHDLLHLPLMQDEKKLGAMKIMNTIFLYVSMISQKLSVLLGLRLMTLSLEYGKTTMTPYGFILYGTYIARAGNVELGFRFGRIGLQIFEQFKMQQWTGRIYYLFYGILHRFRRPIKESVEPLKYACNISLEKGDVEYGLLCGNVSIFSQLQTETLKTLYEELQAHSRKLVIFGQLHSYEMMKGMNATVRNLLWNINPDVNCPSEQLFNENEYCDIKSPSSNIWGWSHIHRTLLYYLFGHYDKAYRHSLACVTSEVMGLYGEGSHALIFIGLADIEYARSKGKSKPTNVKRCIKRIQEFTRYAPWNSLGRKLLLEAELASLGKRQKGVLEKYTCAIALSKHAGFVMETAIAYERTAKYLLRRGDYDMSSSFFEEAIIWYRRWGSEPKVRHLIGEIKQHDCIKVHGV